MVCVYLIAALLNEKDIAQVPFGPDCFVHAPVMPLNLSFFSK
jgi:hypothetical protein